MSQRPVSGCRNRKWVPLAPQATNLFDFRKMLPRKTMPVLVLGMPPSLFRVSFARLTTMGEAMKEAVHAKPLKTGEKPTDTEHDLQLQFWTSSSNSRTCIFCPNSW
jgi:hypothetical protein